MQPFYWSYVFRANMAQLRSLLGDDDYKTWYEQTYPRHSIEEYSAYEIAEMVKGALDAYRAGERELSALCLSAWEALPKIPPPEFVPCNYCYTDCYPSEISLQIDSNYPEIHPEPWPNNALEARDRAAEEVVSGIRALVPLIDGRPMDREEALRRVSQAMYCFQTIARILEKAGAQTRP